MSEMPEEVKFPITHQECPNCGSTRLIANEVLKREIKKGRMKVGANAFLVQYSSAITDPTLSALSFPVIISFFDACWDCGTMVCVHAMLQTAVPGMKQPPPQFDVNARKN